MDSRALTSSSVSFGETGRTKKKEGERKAESNHIVIMSTSVASLAPPLSVIYLPSSAAIKLQQVGVVLPQRRAVGNSQQRNVQILGMLVQR